MKKITKDLIIAICLIAYVLILALAYTKMNIDRLSKDIEVFAGAFLVLGLLGLEKAYKSDDGKTAITAIELLVMSFYSLSIMHMVVETTRVAVFGVLTRHLLVASHQKLRT